MEDGSESRNNTPLIIGGCIGCLAILLCLGGLAGAGAMFYVNAAPEPVDDLYYPG